MQFALARGTCQEVAHTSSRRSGPRRWRRAVEWLIAAGLHPRATATTLRVAEDLADRMDYTTGHVRYCLDEMAARLEMSRATVKRHIGYLRELGGLAWVQHGTRVNIRRALGLKGYAATATVYAAVIPPVYDHAMGHTIVGSGYGARIVIDQRGQAKPVDNPTVDNSSSAGLEPPSLTVKKEEGKPKVDGGEENYTSRERASRDRASIPTQKSTKNSSSDEGTGRHALQVAEDIRITRMVRALVNWTQREGLRRLAFSLRPLIDCGLDSYAIADVLHGLCSGVQWRPASPAAYIRTVLAARQQADRQRQEHVARVEQWELENALPGAFQATVVQQQSVMSALEAGIARYRATVQASGWEDLSRTASAPVIPDTTTSSEADDAAAAAAMAAFLGGTP